MPRFIFQESHIFDPGYGGHLLDTNGRIARRKTKTEAKARGNLPKNGLEKVWKLIQVDP